MVVATTERDAFGGVDEAAVLRSTPKVNFEKSLDLSVLKGRVALVTGGVTGIGLATVKAFAREGAWVAICDLNEEAGKKVEAEMIGQGHK